MSLLRSAFALAISAALLPRVGLAQNSLPALDRASVQIGFTAPDFDTIVRADGSTTGGTQVHLTRDLGLENSNVVGSLSLSWRPFENHEFFLTYFNDDADATRRLDREVVFEDTVYEVDATVHSELDIDAYTFAYVWWAKNEENWALGPRLGMVYYDIGASIELTADANGDQVTGGVREEASPKVPAPVIGGSWRWVPADDWRLKLDAGYFSTSLSDIDGSVSYINAGAEWFPWKNWGLAFNYSYQDVDVESERDAFRGDLDFVNKTATLGVIYRF